MMNPPDMKTQYSLYKSFDPYVISHKSGESVAQKAQCVLISLWDIHDQVLIVRNNSLALSRHTVTALVEDMLCDKHKFPRNRTASFTCTRVCEDELIQARSICIRADAWKLTLYSLLSQSEDDLVCSIALSAQIRCGVLKEIGTIMSGLRD